MKDIERSRDIAQYILAEYGKNISPDDALQLKDTALTLIEEKKILPTTSYEDATELVLERLMS